MNNITIKAGCRAVRSLAVAMNVPEASLCTYRLFPLHTRFRVEKHNFASFFFVRLECWKASMELMWCRPIKTAFFSNFEPSFFAPQLLESFENKFILFVALALLNYFLDFSLLSFLRIHAIHVFSERKHNEHRCQAMMFKINHRQQLCARKFRRDLDCFKCNLNRFFLSRVFRSAPDPDRFSPDLNPAQWYVVGFIRPFRKRIALRKMNGVEIRHSMCAPCDICLRQKWLTELNLHLRQISADYSTILTKYIC